MKNKLLIVIGVFLSLSVKAHIVLESQEAIAGSYYKAVFKVGHGCDGSSINSIVVEIPNGFKGAKPMVKPGWNAAIEKSTLAKSYTSHGKTISEDVSKITWTGGNLPASFYDEFVVVGQLPDQAGSLYWKVKQICEKGEIYWNEIPAPGKTVKDYKEPAALLQVLPAEEHSHHGH